MQQDNPNLDSSTASNRALIDEIESLRLQLSKAESETRKRDQQLQTISKSLEVGYWEWDEVANCAIHFSNQIATIFGIDLEELYARYQRMEDIHSFIHPDDLEIYKKHTSNTRQHLRDYQAPHLFEYRIVLPNGSIRYLRELEYVVLDKDDRIVRSFGVLQDITGTTETFKELTRSEEHFISLFDQLPVGVVEEDYSPVKNLVDKLRLAGVENIREYLELNPGLVREVAGEITITNVNQKLIDLIGADSREDFLKTEADTDSWWHEGWSQLYASEIEGLASGETYLESERVDTKMDGTEIVTRTITRIVKGHKEDWARVITMHEDISDRKRDETALVEAKEVAEKSSKAKSEFLSNMSHELRTPLNAILGFSQLFDYDKHLDERQKSNALEINRAGKHVLVLIDQILDLSRIEAGEVELALEPVLLVDVIDDGLSWVENIAKNRAVDIQFDREAIADVYVYADLIRLKQVFLNLLTNAVKYNREGGTIFFELKFGGGSDISIGVRDTGQGIEENQLDDLFQPFNRLGADSRVTEGTGIGLVITRQLVHLMQGELEVVSTPGTGTTFWVNLSLTENAQSDQVRETIEHQDISEKPSVLKSNQAYILAAEDNAINRELMEAQMEMLGYQVDFAKDGAEALEMWLSGKYYVLMTDIRMPGMNGYELIRQVRSLDITGTHSVSVIAITANAMDSDIEKCYAAGANEVIAKPVELEALKEVLEKWLPREVVDAEVKVADELAPPVNASVIDLNVLQRSVGNKPETHNQLLSSFARSLPEALENFDDAFSWRNHSKIADAGHKLKSSAKSMGALELAELCRLLELAGHAKNWPEIEATMPLLQAHCIQVKDAIKGICSISVEDTNNVGSSQVEKDFIVPEVDITVLIVDDDFVMHRVITTLLNDLGIKKVNSALSGSRALEILTEQPDEIELVICDLNMPGMDGIEFMRHLAAQNYKNSLIITSGEDVRILRTVEKLAVVHELQILGVIKKPVTPAKLKEMFEAFDQMTAEGTIIMTEAFALPELIQAIERDQFEIFFQPKVDLKARRIVGVEALVRWEHPVKGIIRPDAFISLAEDYQLINQLTQLVCKKSINYASLLQKKGIALNIGINISVDALRDLEWPDRVAEQIEQSNLQPSMITFEITESRLMENISVALDILSRLSLKRFNLSIDDFGTGYSSMEQLQRIPFSELKIDRAFVNGAVDSDSARAILESSVLLAKKLDMKVVAEGVENQQDWDLLLDLEVDQVQGYFVSRPLPFDQLLTWLDNWKWGQIGSKK